MLWGDLSGVIMPKPKRQHYEWVPRLNLYRKRIKDVDGKYIPIYAKTEPEMDVKLEEARAVISAGLAAKADPTVRSYAESWLPSVTAEMGSKHKETFETALRLHILPVLGDIHLRDVRQSDCQAVMTRLAGKSSSLQGKVLNVMRRLLEDAVDNEIIARNPCAKVKAGGGKTAKKRPLTDEQSAVLLDAVKGTRAEPFCMIGLYSGLRREEILGLRWEAVYLDDPDPYLEVRLAVTFPTNSKAVVSDALKSDSAARIIPLAPELLAYLQSIRQESGYIIGGDKPLSYQQFSNLWAIVERRQTGEGWYWDKDKDGKQVKVKFMREKGQKSRSGDFCYTIDFHVTPHILRHTCATNWIRNGVDPRTVQYLLGHADPELTLGVYSHVVEESPKALAAAIHKSADVKKDE